MDTKEMEYILEVLKSGSISSAARKLYMSQPLLSQKIHAVEQELNVQIFNRYTSPISLTFAGETVVNSIKNMLQIQKNLLLEINDINDETRGRMKIAISPHRATVLLPKILPVFLHAWPLVEVEVIDSEGKVSEAVINGRADIGFVRKLNTSDKLEYIYLCKDHIVLFCGADSHLVQKYLPGRVINLTEVRNEKFVSVYEGHGFRKIQNELFKNYHVNPHIIIETRSTELACRLALSCNFVALYPCNLLAEESIMKEHPCYYYIEDKFHQYDFYICYKKNAFLPKYIRNFISITQEIYEKAK